jgi:hypothetical protein
LIVGILIGVEMPRAFQRLKQTEPGQLGKISRKMAEAGVNIEVLYSDHDHQLILVADDMTRGRAVSDASARERLSPDHPA